MRWFLASSAALALALACANAAAQSEEDLSRARTLFGEGVQLLADEQWEEAAQRFREVMAVRATGQVKYNLAIALQRTGHLAEAAQLLSEAVEDEALERRQRRHARQLLRQIEPELGLVTITLPPLDSEATVTIDGAEVPADRVGTPYPVDPGERRVALVRGSTILATRTVTVARGESTEVALELSTGESSAPIDSGIDPELLETRRGQSSGGGDVTGEWWFWTAIIGAVVVVAGVAIAVGFAVTPQGQADPVEGNLMPGVLTVTLP